MTPEEELYRDAWLAEMWPTCREIPPELRVSMRAEGPTWICAENDGESRRNDAA